MKYNNFKLDINYKINTIKKQIYKIIYNKK